MGDVFSQPAAKIMEFGAYQLLRKTQMAEYLSQVF